MLVNIDNQDIFKLWESIFDAKDFFQETFFGDNPSSVGVTKPVKQCLITKVGEQRSADDFFFQCTEKAKELFWAFGQKGKKNFAFFKSKGV